MSEQEKSSLNVSLPNWAIKWSHWSNLASSIATAAGIPIAAIGVWIGGTQLEAAKEQQEAAASAQVAQTFAQLGDIWSEHMTLFLEHPELRPFFFNGVKVNEGDPLAGDAEAMVDLRLDAMDRVLTAARLGHIDVSGWTPTFKRAFQTSPLMCAVFQDMPGDYPDIQRSNLANSCFTSQSR